jgi:hypothetical protein
MLVDVNQVLKKLRLHLALNLSVPCTIESVSVMQILGLYKKSSKAIAFENVIQS